MRNMCGIHGSLDAPAEFPAKPLSVERVMQAYPLVRESAWCVPTDTWKAYAGDFLGQAANEQWPAGIMIAEQPNQCIVGLFSYSVRPSLRGGRDMVVADLAAVAPFGREIVADRLLEAIAALARQRGTKETEIVPTHASAWWATALLSGDTRSTIDGAWSG